MYFSLFVSFMVPGIVFGIICAFAAREVMEERKKRQSRSQRHGVSQRHGASQRNTVSQRNAASQRNAVSRHGTNALNNTFSRQDIAYSRTRTNPSLLASANCAASVEPSASPAPKRKLYIGNLGDAA